MLDEAADKIYEIMFDEVSDGMFNMISDKRYNKLFDELFDSLYDINFGNMSHGNILFDRKNRYSSIEPCNKF